MTRHRPRPALVAMLVASSWASNARADDLLGTWHLARAADPVLAFAQANRGVAQEQAVQARAALLPQVAAVVGFTEARDPRAPAGDPESAARSRTRSAALTLNQPVVDFGRAARWREARVLESAQDAALRAAEQALCVRVAAAYLGALTAADALDTTQANEDAYRQQVEQAQARYREGLSALVDVDQARSFHAAAIARTLAARTALDSARDALAELTGRAPGVLLRLRDDLPTPLPEPADAAAWVDAALRDNPTLQAQQRLVAAADAAVRTAESGHLPTVAAAVDVGRGAGWPLPLSNADGRTVTTVGLVLNVPLVSGGATQSQVRQALFRKDAAGDELERQRRMVARETLDRHRGLVAGVAQIAATRTAFDAARKALDATRTGRQLGTRTMTDLLFAIQNVGAAQGAYSQARHRFVLDRLLLQQAVGAIGEADLAAVNALLG